MRKRRITLVVGIFAVCIFGAICIEKLISIDRRENLGLQLVNAAANGDISEARSLLQRGAPIDYANKRMFGDTALILAVDFHSLEMVKFLVECGADVNKAEQHGRTPLMESTYNHNDSIDIAEYLLAHGARLDIKDRMGMTVFQYVEAEPGDAQLLAALKKEQDRRLAAEQSISTNSANR